METTNMLFRNKVRKGTLYQAIDVLITKEFAILEKQIQNYLDAPLLVAISIKSMLTYTIMKI